MLMIAVFAVRDDPAVTGHISSSSRLGACTHSSNSCSQAACVLAWLWSCIALLNKWCKVVHCTSWGGCVERRVFLAVAALRQGRLTCAAHMHALMQCTKHVHMQYGQHKHSSTCVCLLGLVSMLAGWLAGLVENVTADTSCRVTAAACRLLFGVQHVDLKYVDILPLHVAGRRSAASHSYFNSRVAGAAKLWQICGCCIML